MHQAGTEDADGYAAGEGGGTEVQQQTGRRAGKRAGFTHHKGFTSRAG